MSVGAVSSDVPTLLQMWDLGTPTEVTRPERGSNNLVWLVQVAGDSYVLRVHSNAGPEQIALEHRLLAELDRGELSFAVPVPIPVRDGTTLVATDLGPASLYRRLPGNHPPRNEAGLTLAGLALGELDAALAEVAHELAPIDWRRPLDDIHPAVPDVGELAADLQRELSDSKAARWFAQQVVEIDLVVQELRGALPVQLIHGDFGLSNLLVEDGRVTGVLDFEIAGLELRANDLAAGLLQSTDDLEAGQVAAFREGYDAYVALSAAEQDALPTLIMHHAVGSVIWRAGRWRLGLSTIADVADRLTEAHKLAQ
jgi:homoserine kinase type II